jgi:hypothetical protein
VIRVAVPRHLRSTLLAGKILFILLEFLRRHLPILPPQALLWAPGVYKNNKV